MSKANEWLIYFPDDVKLIYIESIMLPTHRKPTQSGKILLEEFLIPLGISRSQFAEHLGDTWTQAKLSDIINGKRAITEEIANAFADALGTSPEFWIALQNDL